MPKSKLNVNKHRFEAQHLFSIQNKIKNICTNRFNFSFGIKQGRVAVVVADVADVVVVVFVAAAIITLTIFQKTLPSLGCVQFRG